MGRWTSDHSDTVLRAKFKCLITGTIERQKLESSENDEKPESAISYRTFVEELDTGDSFTASLVDIMVKELADRQTRIPDDRRAISDATVRRLRSLATHVRVPRERPSSSFRRFLRRPSMHLSEYLTDPPEVMNVEDDEDEFDSMLDSAGQVQEGFRVNSELADVYSSSNSGSHWSHPAPRMRRSLGFANRTDDANSHVPLSPPSANRIGPWTLPPSAPTSSATTLPPLSLAQQPSIRRATGYIPPTREARAMDFNEFTNSRRAAIRQHTISDPRDSSASHRSSFDRVNPRETYDYHVIRSRRYFPFSRFRDSLSQPPWHSESASPSPAGEHDNPSSSQPAGSYFSWNGAPIYSPRLPLPTPSVSSSSPEDSPHEDESTTVVLPPTSRPASRRLRRGGIRAPESMLSRHASPAVTVIHMPPSPVSEPISPPPQNESQESNADIVPIVTL